MLVFGIIISWLLGFSVLNVISYRFSLLEKVGLSFLLGIAFQTLLMLLLDAVGLELTTANILAASAVAILLLNVKTFLHRKDVIGGLKGQHFAMPDLNFVWLVFIVLIAYLEYMNWAKCIVIPTFDRDSLAGFDTIGWIISQEHTLKGLTIFREDYMQGVHGAGSYITYMPMIQLSYAYVYGLGAETSKLIPALVYLSFLVSFYAAVCRFTGHTGAAAATFFTLVTPEMVAFSSLSATNVIHASFASLGVIYTVLWLKNGDRAFFILAAVLTACNLWVRNEGIVFVGASILMILVYKLKGRDFKEVAIYACVSLSPIVLWTVFMKLNNIYADSIIITKPFWDAEKLTVIWDYFKSHFSNRQYYGLSFIFFLIAVAANLLSIIRKKDMVHLLGITVLAMLFYMILLYQIDYKWDTIQNVLAYSAKRFLFCFIPLLWLYGVSNRWGVLLFEKLDRVLTFKL
ncbi:hypothetical protein Barb4_00753 [Bacteroidales bacterium Barb4]|nr:hypothetical protein Barb4_00753 [Bacteroidales bacterium Barb4]